jgi:hypothetical protein
MIYSVYSEVYKIRKWAPYYQVQLCKQVEETKVLALYAHSGLSSAGKAGVVMTSYL